jgi:hypothetical protein
MPLHDAYARLTPYEIAFPDPRRLSNLAAAAAAEATARGVDASALDAFVSLSAVGAFLTELHGDEASRVATLEYAALTFHATRFHEEGCPLFLLETTAARELVAGAPSTEPTPPVGAGYLQLPQHLFWTAGGTGVAPESIDGMFWTVSSDDHLHMMPITGIRPDRPGFGTLAVPQAPLRHAEAWMHVSVREATEDFSSTMPGGEIDGLFAIERAGEVLKLVARFFGHVRERMGSREVPSERSRGGIVPSALPYLRVA